MYAAIFPTNILFKKKTDSARVMRLTTSIGQDVIYAQSKWGKNEESSICNAESFQKGKLDLDL